MPGEESSRLRQAALQPQSLHSCADALPPRHAAIFPRTPASNGQRGGSTVNASFSGAARTTDRCRLWSAIGKAPKFQGRGLKRRRGYSCRVLAETRQTYGAVLALSDPGLEVSREGSRAATSLSAGSDQGFEVSRRWGQTATSSSALCVVSPFSSRKILAAVAYLDNRFWELRDWGPRGSRLRSKPVPA